MPAVGRETLERGVFSILDGIPALLFAARPYPLALGGRGTERDHAPPALGTRSALRMLLFATREVMPRFGISEGLCTLALLLIGRCTPALFVCPAGRCAFIGPLGRWAPPFQAGREPIP